MSGGGRGGETGPILEGYVCMSVLFVDVGGDECVCGLYFPTVPPLGRPWREIHSALHSLYSAVSCHLCTHTYMHAHRQAYAHSHPCMIIAAYAQQTHTKAALHTLICEACH